MIIEKKMIPNMITLMRVFLSCFLCLYLLKFFGSLLIPAITFLLIYMTDYFDGKIARYYQNETHFGERFDVSVDLFYMIIVYMTLYSLDILPLWFFIILIIKFTEFVITSQYINRYLGRKSMFAFDLIGRFVAITFYFIPMMIYISFQCYKPIYFFTINIIIYVITALGFLSSLFRVYLSFKYIKAI